MHELALMESLVEAVGERVQGARVLAVRLEIGRLAAVVPDALRFCFDACARGTCLEGATLDLVEIPGRARCRACGAEGALDDLLAPCACGSFDRELLSGHELRVREVEVI